MTKPTVSQVLANAFGADFSRATQEQRLLLVEAIAFSLRTGCAWQNSLGSVYSRAKVPKMPAVCFCLAGMSRNEGLRLLAVLSEAIVEGYSVLVATERGAHD
jgi:hypothetical protein